MRLFVVLFMFAFVALPSCKNEKFKEKTVIPGDEMAPNTSMEYTSKFICPMHCKGSGSDAPGKCPVCEMDYVKNKDANHPEENDPSNHEGHHNDGHNHEGHRHDGHDHDGHNH